jgi:hypothetical protein
MSVGYRSQAGFGRRGSEARAPARSNDRDGKSARGAGHIALLIGLAALLLAVAVAIFRVVPDFATINAESAQTEDKVTEIVNQPTTHLPRAAPFGLFSPGWFHDGATKPDFNTVDVRASQEFPYKGYTYVASDLNPTEMFVASELEFNAMTKYFYVDRSLPKKRLSEAEMLEINRLYRVIGQDERALVLRWLTVGGLLAFGLALMAAMALVVLRSSQPQAG